jgi:hypothetical protein
MERRKVLKQERGLATVHQTAAAVLENQGFGIRFGNPIGGL